VAVLDLGLACKQLRNDRISSQLTAMLKVMACREQVLNQGAPSAPGQTKKFCGETPEAVTTLCKE